MRPLLLVLVLAGGGCADAPTVFPDASAPRDFSGVGIPDVDGGIGTPCDVFKQKGCAGGLHCTVGLNGANVADECVPDPVTAIPVGGHCNPFGYGRGFVGDLCEPGLVCAVVGDDTQCLKPCFARKECGDGEACVASTGSSTTRPDPLGDFALNACLTAVGCDPITHAGCDGTQYCRYTTRDDVGRVTLCKKKRGGRGAGGDCDTSDDCLGGFMCTLGFCRRLCYFDPVRDGGSSHQYVCPPEEGECQPIGGGGPEIGRCQ